MMLALLAAFQLVASAPAVRPTGDTLFVKDATRSVAVVLVASADLTSSAPMLRADRLRPLLPITVSHLMGDRWMIIVSDKAIELEVGVRLAKVGDDGYQLAAAPELRQGSLYVPLQLVAEIVPRVAGNLVWDPE